MKKKKKAHSKTFSLCREKETPRVGLGGSVERNLYISFLAVAV